MTGNTRAKVLVGFALACVAIIAAFIMWMSWRVVEVLAGPSWCRTALGAEKVSGSDGAIQGLTACVGLLTIQLKSLATNSHILFGALAGCLIVLVVIVVAGGRLDFKANKDEVSANIGRDTAPIADALHASSDALAEKAEEISEARP